MHTAIILPLLLAVAAPARIDPLTAAASPARAAAGARQTPSEREIERRLQELERERERLERERDRQREQAERDRQRQQEQAERDRDRQRTQAERDRENARRERERAQEQAARDRERQRDGSIQEVERLTRTLRIGTAGELHLSNIAGDIVVSRGSGNEAQVEIIKTARGRTSEDARAMLGLVEIDVAERPNRAEISTRYPHGDDPRRVNRRNVNVWVAFNVAVPPATRVRVNSISGSISARDVRGDAVLKSVSGTVKLAAGGGACTAESISGNIEITDSALDGSVTASTASGTVTLRRVKARRIGAHSVSGNVALEEAEATAIDAKSVSGNINLSGPLGRSSRYELGSHSGTVNVAVAGGTGFEVQATSFSGSVRSDFQFDTREPEPGRGRFGRSLRGVVGDGSAVLNLSTFSGSIAILKR